MINTKNWHKYFDCLSATNALIHDVCTNVYNDNNKLIYQAQSEQYQTIQEQINKLKKTYKKAWEGHYKKQIKSYKTELPRITAPNIEYINIVEQQAMQSILYIHGNSENVSQLIHFARVEREDDLHNQQATPEATKEFVKQKNKEIAEKIYNIKNQILSIGLKCNVTGNDIGDYLITTQTNDIMQFLNTNKIRIKKCSGDTVRAYYHNKEKQEKLNFKMLVIHENTTLQTNNNKRKARKDKRQDEIVLFDKNICIPEFKCYPF